MRRTRPILAAAVKNNVVKKSAKSVKSKCDLELKRNAFGVPLIPQKLHKKIFGEVSDYHLSAEKEKEAQDHLKKCNISPDFSTKNLPNVSYLNHLEDELQLEGDVSKHFLKIGEEQVKPFVELIKESFKYGIPQVPKNWKFELGWTRYDRKTGQATSVEHPTEDFLVFDIENCVKEGPWPILATAVSPEAWYSWCSPYLIDIAKKPKNIKCLGKEDLIKMGSPLLIIGHNVSYDRARIADQYDLNLSRTRFLDTMALHISVNGMTSGQRKVKQKEKSDGVGSEIAWSRMTCMNSLNDIYQHYLREKPLKKETRDTFVHGDLNDIKKNFHTLMDYCASDVGATYEVFKVLFPRFQESCPHPVTLSGKSYFYSLMSNS